VIEGKICLSFDQHFILRYRPTNIMKKALIHLDVILNEKCMLSELLHDWLTLSIPAILCYWSYLEILGDLCKWKVIDVAVGVQLIGMVMWCPSINAVICFSWLWHYCVRVLNPLGTLQTRWSLRTIYYVPCISVDILWFVSMLYALCPDDVIAEQYTCLQSQRIPSVHYTSK